MIPKTPFFISPAYWVPRITASWSVKLTLTDVSDVTSSVVGSAGNSPAFKIVKSAPFAKSFFS